MYKRIQIRFEFKTAYWEKNIVTIIHDRKEYIPLVSCIDILYIIIYNECSPRYSKRRLSQYIENHTNTRII